MEHFYEWVVHHLALSAGVWFGALGLLWAALRLAHREQTYSELAEDYGLYGVVGEMGSGKTYLLAWMGVRAARAGRLVFANFPLAGAAGLLTTWTQVLRVPDGSLVLLSEMHLLWPLGKTSKIPEGVQVWATQLRKRTMTCLWDSQFWTQVGLTWRRLTFGVWYGQKAFKAHRYRMYSSFDYGRRGQMAKPLARMFVKRKPTVEAAYDTRYINEGFGAWWERGWTPVVVRRSAASWDELRAAGDRAGGGVA